jgi:4-aminobutyrate aminotransferase-like enzyme
VLVFDRAIRSGLELIPPLGLYANALRMTPPLGISESLIDGGLGILERRGGREHH